MEVVRLLGLERKLDSLPGNLSGGQQQRVAIARALASKPAILLADEPTGNLDSKTSEDVIALLKTTSQTFHQTIVMITHNPEIAQLADRVVRIEDGKILASWQNQEKTRQGATSCRVLGPQIRQQGANVYAGSPCVIEMLSGRLCCILCSASPHWAWAENFCLTAVTLACSTCWVGYQPLSAIWS